MQRFNEDGDSVSTSNVAIAPTRLFNQPITRNANSKWVGFDLDGTLAEYDKWRGIETIGKPIKPMLDLAKELNANGQKIKILTARASDKNAIPYIKAWLENNGLYDIEVTNEKDSYLIKFYDDKAIQVKYNTGQIVENRLNEGVYEYSSAQFIFNDYITAKLKEFARSVIREEDLVEFEQIPHITVKYGIHDSSPEKTFNLVSPLLYNGIVCTIERTELFEGQDSDAVVLKVESEYIRKLNNIITANIPNVTTFPEYIPHITLGYVRKGTGNLYKGKNLLDLFSLTVGEFQFSSSTGMVFDYNIYMYDKSPKWWSN